MGILVAIIGVSVVLLVLFNVFPVLWPTVITASANITAMDETDAGTTFFQSSLSIILLMVGLGIVVGLIVYALNRFGVLSSIKGRLGM